MKRQIILLATLLAIIIPFSTYAADCIQTTNFPYLPDVFLNYKDPVNSSNPTQNVYEICFTGNFKTDEALKIETVENDTIVIKGLKLTKSYNGTAPLLTLSGPITLDTATITGNGSGTLLLAKGSNIVISSSNIQKADIGIQAGDADNVATNLTVKGPNTVISEVKTGILMKNTSGIVINNDVVFNVALGGFKIDPPFVFDLIGKKCDKTIKSSDGKYDICDPSAKGNIVEIAGRAPLGVTPCVAPKSVEIYRVGASESQLVQTCTLAEDIEKTIIMNLKEYPIAKGECAFTCAIPSDALKLDDKIALKFKQSATDPSVETVVAILNKEGTGFEYYKTPFIISLPEVLSTGMGPVVMGPTVSGSDGSDVIIVADNTGGTPETPDTTTLGDVPINTGPQIDPITGQPKAASDNTGGGSSDSGLVNQSAGSSGGCSVTSVMGAANPSQAKACYSFIFALLGLAPIAWRRIKRKNTLPSH